ncbi:MAG: sensor histidine kinase, partial [Oligoflexia bacterium]
MSSVQRKIFLVMAAVSAVMAAICLVIAYIYFERDVVESHKSRYESLTINLAKSIRSMDESTEQTMKSALEALRSRLRGRRLPDRTELTALKHILHVSDISLAGRDGRFVRSSDFDLSTNPNLFSLCSEYRDLASRPDAYQRTPLVPSFLNGRVLKFSLMPTLDRRYILNVSKEINFVQEIFESLMQGDRNIKELSLAAPSGYVLAALRHDGTTFSGRRADHLKGSDGTSEFQYGVTFEPTVPECCECRAKGLSEAKTNRYFYRVVAKIAPTELNRAKARLRRTLAFVFCGILFVAGFLSRELSRNLSARLTAINRKTEELLRMDDPTLRLRLSGSDEVAHIAARFDTLLDQLQLSRTRLFEQQKKTALGALAQQVAHDIRSPLAALNAFEHDLSELSEDKRLLVRSAISRIRDIANNLLNQNKRHTLESQAGESTSLSPQLLSPLLEAALSEARAQYSSRQGLDLGSTIFADAIQGFAAVEPSELKRILSNLINNSVEAIDGPGEVHLKLSRTESGLVLKVRDSGKGIPADVIPRLMSRGESYGKKDGSGLGLFHAKTTVERWGGSIGIASAPGVGTEVTIKFPKVPPPSWYASALLVPAAAKIVILDDDESIHQIWRTRFAHEAIDSARLLHFNDPTQFSSWVNAHRNEAKECLFLIDYEFSRSQTNGLSVIAELGIVSQSV